MEFSDPEMAGYLLQACFAFLILSVLSVVLGMWMHARGHSVGELAAISAIACFGLSNFCLSLAAGVTDNTMAVWVGGFIALACTAAIVVMVLPESLFAKKQRL